MYVRSGFTATGCKKLGFLPEHRVTITTLPRLLLIQVVEEEALELKLLKTRKDYRLALERLNDLSRAKPNTPEGNEAEMLSLLLEEYEQRNPVTEEDSFRNPLTQSEYDWRKSNESVFLRK